MFGIRFLPRVRAFAALVLALPGASEALAQEGGPPFDVWEVAIPALQEAMENGRVTSAQLVDAYVARIRTFDEAGPSLNAILSVNPRARLEAAALDEERARQGPRGPLHGIPVLLKDSFDAAGMPTTAGSFALSGMVPPDDSYVVRRLREAGAVVLGKTNMHELAFGITTVSSQHGQTLNPYDLTRNPGGSSGGTGAAISASFAAVGWGTDTCGSVRIPAAFNALFGLRATKGLISSDGVVPLAHSLDVPGPMARTVTDLAIALDAVVGYDPADSATSILEGVEAPAFVEALDESALRGARLGILREYLNPDATMADFLLDFARTFADGARAEGQGVTDEALQAAGEERELDQVILRALARMQELGAEIVVVDTPDLDSLLAGSEIIDYEFKFDLEKYLAETPSSPVDSLGDIITRGLYHPSIKDLLIRRNEPVSLDTDWYREGIAELAMVRDILTGLFERERLDALVYPTMRRAPAEIGSPQWGSTCRLSTSSGFPAITIPTGFDSRGTPVGVELLGRPMDDAKLVGFAYAYERKAYPRLPPRTTPSLTVLSNSEPAR